MALELTRDEILILIRHKADEISSGVSDDLNGYTQSLGGVSKIQFEDLDRHITDIRVLTDELFPDHTI